MRSTAIIIMHLTAISFCSTLSCQENPDTVYGLDPVLYNGTLYASYMPGNVNGHPYLFSSGFEPGYVIIKGRKFDNVLLNYDIFNQKLLLKYQDLNGSGRIILLSQAWMNVFSLQDKQFEYIDAGTGQKKLFQVIGNDTLKILYSWKKELSLSNQAGNTGYYFSDPVKTMYLYGNNGLYRFRNNRNFIDFFYPEIKSKIAIYLRENRINVRKASDRNMLLLINNCNEI